MGTTKNKLIFKILLKLVNFEFVFGFDSLGFDSQVSKKMYVCITKFKKPKQERLTRIQDLYVIKLILIHHYIVPLH